MDYLVYFFGGVVKIFFLPLGHQVIQVAQLPLGEAQVQHFSNENQSEHLETRKQRIPFVKMETENREQRVVLVVQLTIMGKTMAAGDVLITQSNTRHVSWVTVNR